MNFWRSLVFTLVCASGGLIMMLAWGRLRFFYWGMRGLMALAGVHFGLAAFYFWRFRHRSRWLVLAVSCAAALAGVMLVARLWLG